MPKRFTLQRYLRLERSGVAYCIRDRQVPRGGSWWGSILIDGHEVMGRRCKSCFDSFVMLSMREKYCSQSIGRGSFSGWENGVCHSLFLFGSGWSFQIQKLLLLTALMGCWLLRLWTMSLLIWTFSVVYISRIRIPLGHRQFQTAISLGTRTAIGRVWIKQKKPTQLAGTDTEAHASLDSLGSHLFSSVLIRCFG